MVTVSSQCQAITDQYQNFQSMLREAMAHVEIGHWYNKVPRTKKPYTLPDFI